MPALYQPQITTLWVQDDGQGTVDELLSDDLLGVNTRVTLIAKGCRRTSTFYEGSERVFAGGLVAAAPNQPSWFGRTSATNRAHGVLAAKSRTRAQPPHLTQTCPNPLDAFLDRLAPFIQL